MVRPSHSSVVLVTKRRGMGDIGKELKTIWNIISKLSMDLIYHLVLSLIFAPVIVCVLNKESHLWQSVTVVFEPHTNHTVVFEHCTIVLQVRAGSEVSCGTSDGD